MIDTPKAGIRNSRRSMNGSASVVCRRTKTALSTSPARIAAATTASKPPCAPRLTPKITSSTAASDSAALTRSSRPASGSRASGSTSGPSTSSNSITGTPSRNTEPHQKYSSSAPPISGPIALPTEKPETQTPIATERWAGSANMVRISASVEGMSVAPASPNRARLAINHSALGENAARVEAKPNQAAPISNKRRRPMRSPSVPMVISAPAIRNP